MSEYSETIRCRMCLGGTKPVLELTPTPIANHFTDTPEPYAPRYQLELRECGSCGHVQIGYEIPGEKLFKDYKYQTPQAERSRLSDYAEYLMKQFPQAARAPGQSKNYEEGRANVLEIGSNNGIFVEELNKAGMWAVGVDPSPAAPMSGMPKWFNSKTAKLIEFSMGKFHLVLANNTFAHVDDIRNTFQGIDTVLRPDGHVVFEVQYLPAMVAGGMFDMIYHEHKDYHTLAPFKRMLKKFNMCVYKVEHLPTHGGSVRIYVKRGLDGIDLKDPVIDWKEFSDRIERERMRIRDAIGNSKIAAFGATAKACTLIHHFGLQNNILYCVDETPSKQGKYIPGTAIQIVPPSRLDEQKPDAILLTAWNYASVLKPRFQQPVVVPFERAA